MVTNKEFIVLCTAQERQNKIYFYQEKIYNPRQEIYGFTEKGTEISHCNRQPYQQTTAEFCGEIDLKVLKKALKEDDEFCRYL